MPIYIVHLSAAEALEMVTEARDRGLPAYAETCPQYLFLSYDNYEEPGFDGAKYVMSPPLRPKETQDRLWRGLAFNDLQAISTDHCPFCMKEQKTLGEDDFSKIPNGAPGIETRMSLVYDGGVRTGRISLNRFVELTSTSPAKIFGLFPTQGHHRARLRRRHRHLRSGEDDALSAKTLHMNVDYNPYEGREVTGATDTVISRGKVVIDGGKFIGRAGAGSFLKTERPMTGDEIIALSKKHTIFEWSAQGAVDPDPGGAREGRLLLDAGRQALHRLQQPADVREHRPRRPARASRRSRSRPRRSPTSTRGMATEPRARLGAKLAEITPGRHRRLLLHERRRRGERKRVQDRARVHRPAEDPGALPLVSRRHGRARSPRPASRGAGARRRCRASCTCSIRITASSAAGTRPRNRSRYLEEVIQLEGPQTIAAFILESVTGTNGILIPPDGYLQGVRALCDKHGILMIADEVMCGLRPHGRVVRDRTTGTSCPT